ncbi:hypothetical protein [Flavobacterium sp.]|uniref:hypothetical protein n=1 Tax=Flavobacterium sp. TaxID=239 RepID=UPI0031DE578E
MKIEIVENSKRSLFVYKENELYYSSTFKNNWLNRIVSIFNHNNELILKVKIGGFFMDSPYQFQFQPTVSAFDIKGINESNIYLDKNRNLIKKYESRFISLNWNYSYFLNKKKIADVKNNLWKSPLKITLLIEDQNLEFLDSIIIHILSTETGKSY